jgi:hypothetical protein
MEVGCMIFGMTQKRPKKYTRGNGLQGWNDVAVWRDFKPQYILGDIWPQYIEHVMSKWFTRRSQSGFDNQNWQINGSVTTHTGGSISFSAYVKRMVKLI